MVNVLTHTGQLMIKTRNNKQYRYKFVFEQYKTLEITKFLSDNIEYPETVLFPLYSANQ